MGLLYALYVCLTFYISRHDEPVHADVARHEVPQQEGVGEAGGSWAQGRVWLLLLLLAIAAHTSSSSCVLYHPMSSCILMAAKSLCMVFPRCCTSTHYVCCIVSGVPLLP